MKKKLVIFIIIIVVLAVLGVGGYFGYQYYVEYNTAAVPKVTSVSTNEEHLVTIKFEVDKEKLVLTDNAGKSTTFIYEERVENPPR